MIALPSGVCGYIILLRLLVMYDGCNGGAHGHHLVLGSMARSATMVYSTRRAFMFLAPSAVPSGGQEHD